MTVTFITEELTTEHYEEFTDFELTLIESITEATGYCLDESAEYIRQENYIVYHGMTTMAEVAHYLHTEHRDSLELEDDALRMIDKLSHVADWDTLGNDLTAEGSYCYSPVGIIEIIG